MAIDFHCGNFCNLKHSGFLNHSSEDAGGDCSAPCALLDSANGQLLGESLLCPTAPTPHLAPPHHVQVFT